MGVLVISREIRNFRTVDLANMIRLLQEIRRFTSDKELKEKCMLCVVDSKRLSRSLEFVEKRMFLVIHTAQFKVKREPQC